MEPPSELGIAANSTPMTTIRKSNWFYDDSLFYDLDTFEIANSITDYTIWKTDDTNQDYDYLTVDAFTTWYPAYDNRDIINGIQGTIDNRYSSDSLIDYTPNTGTLDKAMQNGTSYSVSVGYPWTASFQVQWSSGAKVGMQARGDRSTGRYYQFFYGTDWGVYNSVGSGDPIDTRYSAVYYSSGSLLSVYVWSQVRHQWFNESTSEWKGGQETLTYDY